MLAGLVLLSLYSSVRGLKHPIQRCTFYVSLTIKFQYKRKSRLIPHTWVQLERKCGLCVTVSIGGVEGASTLLSSGDPTPASRHRSISSLDQKELSYTHCSTFGQASI